MDADYPRKWVIFARLRTARPTTVSDSKGIDPRGYWFLYPHILGKDPITEVEIRIIRSRDEEVLPWTKITLNPDVWPLVIPLP